MVSSQHRLPDRPGDPNLFNGQDPGRGRRLGIDVGSVRIGVAASDPDGILATPVETVRRDRSGKHLRRLAELAAELEAVEVIVGLPRTLADRTGPVGPRRDRTGRRRWHAELRPPRCGSPMSG